VSNDFSRSYLSAASCSGYFLIGLVASLTGVGLNSFAEQLSISPTQVGSYFFFFIGSSTFILLFAAGMLIDRFGQKPVLVASSLICAVAFLLVSQVHSLAEACFCMFLLGTGSAGMNGGLNTLINHLYPANRGQALNLANMFFGLGALSLPFIASLLLTSFGLVSLLVLASLFCFLPAILFATGRFPPDVAVEKFALKEAASALSYPLVGLFALILFFYVGLEASIGTWSRLAVVEKWQITNPLDQLILAGYWSSLVLGRLFAGTVFKNISDHKLVLLCAGGACAGIIVFILAPSLYLGACALWFTGLCFAPIFPSTLATAGNIYKNYTGTIFSLFIACGVLGGVALTTGVGQIAGISTLSKAFALILASALLLLAVQFLASRRITKDYLAAKASQSR
jgi:FHS family glucose/mannose:H+ symporter-like MFS transporter